MSGKAIAAFVVGVLIGVIGMYFARKTPVTGTPPGVSSQPGAVAKGSGGPPYPPHGHPMGPDCSVSHEESECFIEADSIFSYGGGTHSGKAIHLSPGKGDFLTLQHNKAFTVRFDQIGNGCSNASPFGPNSFSHDVTAPDAKGNYTFHSGPGDTGSQGCYYKTHLKEDASGKTGDPHIYVGDGAEPLP